MSNEIHVFETLDVPPDITLQGYNYRGHHREYFFCKRQHPKPVYFKILFSADRESYVCIETDEKGFYNGAEVFADICSPTLASMNDLLWRISDCPYEMRFLKLELMERLRLIDTERDMEHVLEYIKQFYKSEVASNDNSSTD